MSKLETSGYRRFWEMRQHLGRETLPDGSRVEHSQECFRDMVTGQIHHPASDGELLGWNGSPPDLPSGDKAREGMERSQMELYRTNFSLIDWGGKD